jgi:hypothetical protein
MPAAVPRKAPPGILGGATSKRSCLPTPQYAGYSWSGKFRAFLVRAGMSNA